MRGILRRKEFAVWQLANNMQMLHQHDTFRGVDGPVLTIVMDGVGLAPATEANAVHEA